MLKYSQISESMYFQFGPIAKKMWKITVPQLYTLTWKVEYLFEAGTKHSSGGPKSLENLVFQNAFKYLAESSFDFQNFLLGKRLICPKNGDPVAMYVFSAFEFLKNCIWK